MSSAFRMKTLKAFNALMKSTDPMTRQAAVLGLACMGGKGPKMRLARLATTEQDESVLAVIKSALAELGE